jgi:hypothetical protein
MRNDLVTTRPGAILWALLTMSRNFVNSVQQHLLTLAAGGKWALVISTLARCRLPWVTVTDTVARLRR